jgi:hypothetical protein
LLNPIASESQSFPVVEEDSAEAVAAVEDLVADDHTLAKSHTCNSHHTVLLAVDQEWLLNTCILTTQLADLVTS